MRHAAAFGALAAIAALALWFASATSGAEAGAGPRLRVLAYSSFVNEWGPGPQLARDFAARTGVQVELLDGGDAGLLIGKLRGAEADVALGFDQLSLPLARASFAWAPLRAEAGAAADADPAADQTRFDQPDFLAFDWSPLAFISRVGGGDGDGDGPVAPPTSLDDLTDARFRGALALPDPRASSPGLQFLLWVLDAKGVDEGFAWLARLAPNVRATTSSWSAAYGLFQKRETKLGFAYLTSPIYHRLEEGDASFVAASFADGAPAQIEYAGVPATCRQCATASAFVRWLREPAAQRLIMRKNAMLPVRDEAAAGDPLYARALEVARRQPLRAIRDLDALLARRDELFARWTRTGM